MIYNVVVIGAGPAGLAAAASAKENGAEHVLIVERDVRAGGILQQCIHAGFGLKYFGEELSGPEYAERFEDIAREKGIDIMLDTMALEIRDHELVCSNRNGLEIIGFKSLVLAMGCREKTRANLVIPGSRPAGIYTAGTAQKLINIFGHSVGKEVVILGSGDIGMIMARRLTLGGAKVKAVVEIMPFLAGLVRNKVQCLDDFGIPLLLSHTVVDITGIDRVESVTIAPVDENKNPVMEKAEVISCDTLLLSVGLIPENELTRIAGVKLSPVTRGAEVNQFNQTSEESIFACGNVLHVNDLVDHVSLESEIAGKSAALYSLGKLAKGNEINTEAGKGVRYVCPQRISLAGEEELTLYFRTLYPGRGTRTSAYLETVDANGSILKKELIAKKSICTSPGTMENLTLTTEMLYEIKNAMKNEGLTGKIVVEAEHEELM